MRLLILDNYDSFTFNLVHLVEKVSNIEFDVVLNDKITLEEIDRYDKIILSPGPGLPSAAGIMPAFLKKYTVNKSILGVCLGMQAIGENFGCPLRNLKDVYHGIATEISVAANDSIFRNLPKSFKAGRYHSWVIDEMQVKEEINVTATDNLGQIMAIRHKRYDVCGVQFHPESVLSEYGEQLIFNWLN